jgi:hypothetical protein
MKCTFIEGNFFLSCKANKEVYVPSLFEFREYCSGKQYKMCPHFFKAIMSSWRFCKRPLKLVPPRFIGIE